MNRQLCDIIIETATMLPDPPEWIEQLVSDIRATALGSGESPSTPEQLELLAFADELEDSLARRIDFETNQNS